MGDVYIEHLVKKRPDIKALLMKAVIIGAFGLVAGVFIMLAFAMTPLFLVLVLVLAFAAMHAMSYFNVEYEYLFTNGEIDIDIIYSKSRRKNLFSGEIKSFEIMCHATETAHNNLFSNADTKKDFTSGEINENTYKFYVNQKGKRFAVLIEPSDELLKAFRLYLNTSKLILKK